MLIVYKGFAEAKLNDINNYKKTKKIVSMTKISFTFHLLCFKLLPNHLHTNQMIQNNLSTDILTFFLNRTYISNFDLVVLDILNATHVSNTSSMSYCSQNLPFSVFFLKIKFFMV